MAVGEEYDEREITLTVHHIVQAADEERSKAAAGRIGEVLLGESNATSLVVLAICLRASLVGLDLDLQRLTVAAVAEMALVGGVEGAALTGC